MCGRVSRLVVAAALLVLLFQSGLNRVAARKAAGNVDPCAWPAGGYTAGSSCWQTSPAVMPMVDGTFWIGTGADPGDAWSPGVSEGDVASDDPKQRGGLESALWAGHCSLAAQTVDFRRTAILPGVPAELFLTLGTAAFSHGPNPVMALALLINGHPVLSTAATARRVELGAGIRSLLRLGPNTFELKARKAPSAASTCGGGMAQFGVFAELWGRYVADASVAERPKLGHYPCCIYDYTIVNNGPSPVLGGTVFGWHISTPKLNCPKYREIVLVKPAGRIEDPTFRGCGHSPEGYGFNIALMRPLYAGQRIEVQVVFPYGPYPSKASLDALPDKVFVDHFRTSWSFNNGYDPTPRDNAGSAPYTVRISYRNGAPLIDDTKY